MTNMHILSNIWTRHVDNALNTTLARWQRETMTNNLRNFFFDKTPRDKNINETGTSNLTFFYKIIFPEAITDSFGNFLRRYTASFTGENLGQTQAIITLIIAEFRISYLCNDDLYGTQFRICIFDSRVENCNKSLQHGHLMLAKRSFQFGDCLRSRVNEMN